MEKYRATCTRFLLYELADALTGLMHSRDVLPTGRACWCDVAIGNPMLQGKHTHACARARKAWEEAGRRGLLR